MTNWIDRDLLLKYLSDVDIPLTKSEKEIIQGMPCRDDMDYSEKQYKLDRLLNDIRERNCSKPHIEAYDDLVVIE